MLSTRKNGEAMVEIIPVSSRKEQREFLQFPLRLYRGNPCFVPPLYREEKMIFSEKYVYYKTCESACFLARRNGVTVGRISAILQKASNEKRGERRIRFTRFDAINDQEVANALFGAVEEYAREKGMDTVCGPLGFSDLEREGLLVEGFDELSTFEEQYNAEYYGTLIENCGYAKEVDWVESRIYAPPPEEAEKMQKTAAFVLKRYNLRIGEAKNINDFLRRYGEGFFALLDEAYEGLYGTVPFTDEMRKMLVENFRLIANPRHVAAVLDEHDRVVCLGVCFPSLAKALQPSMGRLTPAALVRVLRAIRHPQILDLGLIAVAPSYQNRGISAVIMAELSRMLREDGVKYAETNLNLEDNFSVRNQWKRFASVEHKRRRSYVKKLEETPV